MNNAMRYTLTTLFASIALLSATAFSENEEDRPFSEIIVFGDSYSDTGNFYRSTNGAFPNDPYFQGRASNGILWVEHLSTSLNLTLSPENQYAYLGAESGIGNFHNQSPSNRFPGFHQQIDSFLTDHQEQPADSAALFVIWVGSYDFYSWLATGSKSPSRVVEDSITNIITGLTALVDSGARHILIVNLPDLGSLPLGLNLGPEISELLSSSVVAFNSLLDDAIVAIAQLQNTRFTRVDAFSIINTIIENDEAFGFENAHDSAIESAQTGSSDAYLFWDSTHLTTEGHEILADFALQALIESYSPNNGPILNKDPNRALKATFHFSK